MTCKSQESSANYIVDRLNRVGVMTKLRKEGRRGWVSKQYGQKNHYICRASFGGLAISLLLMTNNSYADTPIITKISYDAENNITAVTDPRGLITTYAYDGIGLLWEQTGPDTGATLFTSDAYGRESGMTRADGLQTSYGFDGINRVVTISAGGLTQSITYDTCTNGKGRLCSDGDSAHATSYSYTPEGWVAGRGFTLAGTTYALGYSYDAVGNVSSVLYPDGNKATYSYNNGSVSSIALTVSGISSSGVTGITYRPGNRAVASWTSSNGIANTLNYDSDGRLTSISAPGVQSLGFLYDGADRLTVLTNSIDSSATQGFTYDSMSRLASVSSMVDNEAFVYDSNGNRIAQTVNGASLTSIVESNSNRLVEVTGAGGAQYGYDPQGNTTTISSLPMYHFDAFNRMDSAGTSTYYVNPEGLRLAKQVSGATTFFAPDRSGALLAEKGLGGWTDYVWFNGRLIATISAGQVYAVHDDQIGRPEVMTNSLGVAVWRAQNLAFSRNITLSSGPTLNLGFPGQYYDAETGNWNNGYRDYRSDIGRYIESDPSGLAGGTNTYAFVGSNPEGLTAPLGLRPDTDLCAGLSAKGCLQVGAVFSPSYTQFSGSWYIFSASLSITGDTVFYSFNISRNYDGEASLFKPSFSVELGFLNDPCDNISDQRKMADALLSGFSQSASGFLMGGGATEVYSPGSGSATQIGVGFGFQSFSKGVTLTPGGNGQVLWNFGGASK